MIRTSIALALIVSFFTACTGGSGSGDRDGSVAVRDADPSAPDGSVNGGDGGAITDAAVGAADAAATAGIECGESTCDESTQECCVTGSMGGGPSFECVAPGSCQGTSSTCDGPEDCGGDICCGSLGGASCTDSCPGGASAELCHESSDCSVPGDMCCSFGPLSICAAQCGGPGGGGN